MAAALRIDTLKFVRQLTDAGMDERQAEAIVRGVAEIDASELASKSDIMRLETKIADLKAEIFRFMLLQAVGIIGLTVTLVKLLP